jgi:hypothetical protein
VGYTELSLPIAELTLLAAGGGDGPEAVTAAMAASLTELIWRKDAARMAVLIADAPPHGELLRYRRIYSAVADVGRRYRRIRRP